MKTFLQFVEMHSLHFDKPPTGKYRIILYGLLDELMKSKNGEKPFLDLDSLGYIAPTVNTPLMIKAKEFLKEYPSISAENFYFKFLVPNSNLFLKNPISIEEPNWGSRNNSSPKWNKDDENAPTNIAKRNDPPLGWNKDDENAPTNIAKRK